MAADDGREHYEKLYSSYWALPHFRFEYNKFKHRVKAIVADNAVRIAPNDTAVDLGCGLGPKTYVLSEFFAHTTGIDFIQNCVQIATLLNDRPTLRFVWEDVNTHDREPRRYEFVTALGLSIFNEKDADTLLKNLREITAKYAAEKHTVIIGSETDFSGKSPSGWYYHTRSEIKQIAQKMEREGYAVKNYFPHRSIRNYRGNGIRHLLLETYRLLFARKREYYFILTKA